MQRHAKLSLDKDILLGLSRRTALPWLKDAALDWAVILGALGVVHLFSNPVTWLLALLIIGNRQHALAILGHDGTHFTLSHDRRLNDYLTNLLAFWPIGLTVSGYRTLHFKHHKHTGTEDDPELGHKRSRSPQWDLPAKPSRILKYAVLDIVGGSFPDYLIILKYSKPDKAVRISAAVVLPRRCHHIVRRIRTVVGRIAVVCRSGYDFHDVVSSQAVAGASGNAGNASPVSELLAGCASGAAQRLASLGAPQISDSPVSQAAASPAAPQRSRHSDAARSHQRARQHPAHPLGDSAQGFGGDRRLTGGRQENSPAPEKQTPPPRLYYSEK